MLSGCSERLDSWELLKAIKTCVDIDNIDHMVVSEVHPTVVYCKDGNGYWIKGNGDVSFNRQ